MQGKEGYRAGIIFWDTPIHYKQTKTTKKKGKVARKPCNNGVFNKVGRDKRLYLEKDHAEMSSPVELTSMLMLTQ